MATRDGYGCHNVLSDESLYQTLVTSVKKAYITLWLHLCRHLLGGPFVTLNWLITLWVLGGWSPAY